MPEEEKRILINGRECRLTRTEYEVYDWMRRRCGSVVSRETLLRNVWGFLSPGNTRSVDMCVRRLRAKIGPDSIQTVYGKGYLLTI